MNILEDYKDIPKNCLKAVVPNIVTVHSLFLFL